MGSLGVGKTCHATAFAVDVLQHGKTAYFITLSHLMDDLEKRNAKGVLVRRHKFYAHPDLLIIDEVGYSLVQQFAPEDLGLQNTHGRFP